MTGLKNRNRVLLEVNTGVLILMLLCFLAGMILPLENMKVSGVDWYGSIALAAALDVLSFGHMYRCLDRALDFGETDASKFIVRGYLIRYAAFAGILILVSVLPVLNPLILCLAYLFTMKVAAYSQPYTHKLYNWLFHETDPVPEPLDEEAKEKSN